ncbi:kelch repeat and BTB domain-containing protein 12 [Selaginella moellendorffii]|nr:kelch repeat and BTB domain-containing protein 12 [Selaginella moellendorffii]|eukprot:XP_002970328.2 kelch repeat and BTB domain-containing protein 12 [Selaginella moellendorffii]
MEVESPAHLSAACERLLSSGLYSDITFQTGDDSTPAHRCILASLSPVFSTMLSAGLQEQETATIAITDMTTPQLRAFLLFLYTGRLEQQKVAESGLAVLAACHKYCLPGALMNACVAGLSRSITCENCLGLLELADLYGQETLAAKCRSFVTSHLSEFLDCNGKALVSKNAELLLDLVRERLPPLGFREIKLWFRRYNTQKVRLHKVVLPAGSTVAELVSEVNKQLNRPKKLRVSLRILQVFNHRIGRIFKRKDPISVISQEESDGDGLRAEEVPPDDEKSVAGKSVIHVHHFRTGTWSYEAFGEPFAMHVHHQETLRRIKQRIKARLAVSNETFEKWKFAKFHTVPGLNDYVPPVYLDDNMPMAVLLTVDGCSSSRAMSTLPLGIHHTQDVLGSCK